VAVLNFGAGRDLTINFREPIGIQQGAGLHRLIIPVRMLAINQLGDGIPLDVSGCAWLSMTGMEWLGNWRLERLQATRTMEFQTNLVLTLSDEQLAVIEARRKGGAVQLLFDTDVVLYDPSVPANSGPDLWPVRSFQENVHIFSETWRRMLDQTAIAFSMALVVPVPLDASPQARVGSHLRNAIRKVNDGEFEDAVTAARRAVESMSGNWESMRSIVDTPRDDRSLDQRLSLLRHALFSLASPSAHDDPVAASIQWDRETAMTVIAGVAALAATKSAMTPAAAEDASEEDDGRTADSRG